MKNRLLIPFFLLFLGITPLIAQKEKNKKSSKNDDSTVIIFGDENNEEKKRNTPQNNVILKISPTAFVIGRFPIEIEKEMKDWLSLQAGIGITFNSVAGNIYQSILSQEVFVYEDPQTKSNWTTDIYDEYGDFNIRKSGTGFLFSLSPRFFFASDGYEGSYFAPNFGFSTQRTNVQKIDETKFDLSRLENVWQKESDKNIDFSIRYGYQVLYPRLSLEYFAGVGIRNTKNTRQDIGIDANGIYRNGERTYNTKSFLPEIGLRVGFQF